MNPVELFRDSVEHSCFEHPQYAQGSDGTRAGGWGARRVRARRFACKPGERAWFDEKAASNSPGVFSGFLWPVLSRAHVTEEKGPVRK